MNIGDIYLEVRRSREIIPDALSEPFQISKLERFAKIVNGSYPVTIFAKRCNYFCKTLHLDV